VTKTVVSASFGFLPALHQAHGQAFYAVAHKPSSQPPDRIFGKDIYRIGPEYSILV
jgi:hypothetical protein